MNCKYFNSTDKGFGGKAKVVLEDSRGDDVLVTTIKGGTGDEVGKHKKSSKRGRWGLL